MAALSLLATGAIPATPAAAASTRLVVLDWNIRGESADMKAIAAVIRRSHANIVTLQEIHRKPGNDQVARLAKALGWSITRNAHFGAGDSPGPCDKPQAGKAGNAILSAFPIVERVTIPLTSFSTCPVNRSMAGVKLDLGGGRTIRVFTTHLSPGLSGTSVRRRQAQAAKVLGYFGSRSSLILTGDFNAPPADALSKRFAKAGWTDAAAKQAPSPTHGSARIDYVYTRGVAATSGSVKATSLSDHRPLVITLTR